ncbi:MULTISPECIES: hypothetical protein [Streptacidiphilus]|uniref:Uncharacterized protein n=1 Tax=Streptacidiphilus cavernicola TaxID=3342716 RepID=A0ABV6UWA5_9ACTN|nr:hypothetical protein [Streptacidiphilus jeojiense]
MFTAAANTPAEPAIYHPAPVETSATLPYLSPFPIPGAIEAQTPDGRRVWVYAATYGSPAPAPSQQTAAPSAVPAWVKATALVSLSLSGSSVMVAYAISVAADALAGLAATLVMLAKVAFVLAVLLGILAAVVKRKGGGNVTATASTTATARGPFAKATATATATAIARK